MPNTQKLTLSEMKELCPTWFGAGEMKFFNTIIETIPNKINIFITSERMSSDHRKLYTLRWFNTESNMVETLGEFHSIATLDEAKELRKHYTKAYLEWHNAPMFKKPDHDEIKSL